MLLFSTNRTLLLFVLGWLSAQVASQNVGIGILNPTDGLHLRVDTNLSDNLMRVQIGNSTKFRLLRNGGLSIGTNNVAGTPENGVYVHGNTGLGLGFSPDRLGVNGDINLTGTIKTNGSMGSQGQVLVANGNGGMNWSDPCQYNHFEDFPDESITYNWKVPVGVTRVLFELWGAGGGAGPEGGGGGGGFCRVQLDVTPLAIYTINVGKGGIGSGQSNNGTNGEDTEVSGPGITTLIAAGGGRGTTFSSGVGGGVVVEPSTIQSYMEVGESGNPTLLEYQEYQPGQFARIWNYGTGGSGGNTVNTGGKGDQAARDYNTSTVLHANFSGSARSPGGGGGASETGKNGADGYVIVMW